MHVMITGASNGIGAACAKRFAALPNIHLYLISRNTALLDNVKLECKSVNSNSQIHLLPFDIKNIGHKEFALPKECKHIDVLINNAGFLVNKTFQELSDEDVSNMLEVNFIAPGKLIRHLMPYFGKDAKTHVVNIGSMGGFQGSAKFRGLSVYSASKAAIASLTECLAVEYANQNISFNCLALGAVQTEMLEEAFPGFKAPLNTEEMAGFIKDFALNGHKYMNGKILPVSLATP